jgi:hypothetical protein
MRNAWSGWGVDIDDSIYEKQLVDCFDNVQTFWKLDFSSKLVLKTTT